MKQAIYLSVGKPNWSGLTTDDQMETTEAIRTAILSFIHVFLGRRELIWTGHPEINSQIKFMSEELKIDYDSWVKTYPSSEIMKNGNQIAKRNKESNSVSRISHPNFNVRESMFKKHDFSHAVFIGGDEKTIEEYNQFKVHNPKAKIIPVLPTGGVTYKISLKEGNNFDVNIRKRKYILKFYELLEINIKECRYYSPEEKRQVEAVKNLLKIPQVDSIETIGVGTDVATVAEATAIGREFTVKTFAESRADRSTVVGRVAFETLAVGSAVVGKDALESLAYGSAVVGKDALESLADGSAVVGRNVFKSLTDGCTVVGRDIVRNLGFERNVIQGLSINNSSDNAKILSIENHLMSKLFYNAHKFVDTSNEKYARELR